MVVSLLYGQFNQLNEEFSKCISERGQFSGNFGQFRRETDISPPPLDISPKTFPNPREFGGNFGQFRRRHQAISRSVQEADRFLMICNAAYICCQIFAIIFVFYSTIFYRDFTITSDPGFAVLCIVWLSVSVLGLALTAGQAIVLNHVASISYLQ